MDQNQNTRGTYTFALPRAIAIVRAKNAMARKNSATAIEIGTAHNARPRAMLSIRRSFHKRHISREPL
jgi:hypothetical protein